MTFKCLRLTDDEVKTLDDTQQECLNEMKKRRAYLETLSTGALLK